MSLQVHNILLDLTLSPVWQIVCHFIYVHNRWKHVQVVAICFLCDTILDVSDLPCFDASKCTLYANVNTLILPLLSRSVCLVWWRVREDRLCVSRGKRQPNKQVLKEREMKGKTDLRLERERRREQRKRYVMFCWMSTVEVFMRSQSETSNTVENIAHFSSFFSFVFSVREAVCKSYTLVRYDCSCLKDTQIPEFINRLTFASSTWRKNRFLFLHTFCLLSCRFSLWDKNIAARKPLVKRGRSFRTIYTFLAATSSSIGRSVVQSVGWSTKISPSLAATVFTLEGWNLAWRSSVCVCVCVWRCVFVSMPSG